MQTNSFFKRLIHPLSADEKIIVTQDIRQSATSSFDFFLLVFLSCSIATLGLITDSPAVIISAMLVAPLMSPIIGIGMAFGLEARVPFLDVKSVALGLGMPAEWKVHKDKPAKFLLRQAFTADLPEEIVNRPKQKFSKGAGSSEVISQMAEQEISHAEFLSEHARLSYQWDYRLSNKEGLYYYRMLRESYQDQWIFPTMGHSRGL